jgi:hypothetical protein
MEGVRADRLHGGRASAWSFTARLGLAQGRPTCQQVVSSNPTRSLASHHGAPSATLPEQS